ncbi:PepSY-like domain-containing protein [Ferruginibacter albus]|uniref:PepSY-like domain-containing protein n=1 Tax=Ferruginibacter albus TaxID=2875540 RepID=UPI001CC5B05C|nr:PepSY-like domain-containing protein [Ferruginibacter albus]UAY51256.1 PepSY-like domain-containing protein [Ferruginibacter albus]
MKKIILLVMISLTTSIAIAQKISASNVPETVKASFNKLFSGINAKWEKENGNYEAAFKQKGKDMAATFTPDGNYLESETAIKTSELPSASVTYLQQNYKEQKIKGAEKISKADGTINYEAEVNGVDVLFDSDGKFIKEEKD